MSEWLGDKPVFLVIRQYLETGPVSAVVDLDEGGWAQKHKDLMRVPGAWMLCHKEASKAKGMLVPLLILQVEEGDQPFFAMRHVGIMSFGTSPGPENVSYGIGKKRPGGRVESAWILPNGSIAVNDDVYWVADRMNKGKL